MNKIIAFIITSVFAISETGHFGNNLTAKSDAEVICDGLIGIMFLMIILKE